MLNYHTIRFATDVFGLTETKEDDDGGQSTEVVATFNKKALLIAKTAWDCTEAKTVTGFKIWGTEPTGTTRAVAFKIGDAIYKLTAAGALEDINLSGSVTVATVTAKGNSVAELQALTNIPGFVGKEIYPIIALSTTKEDTAPTIRIVLKSTVGSDTLGKTRTSPVYELTDGTGTPRITGITADITTTGNAAASAQVRLRLDDTWSSYMALAEATDQEADAVQFKLKYHVSTADGSESARINQIVVGHTLGKTVVSGDDADLYSIVANYEVPLQFCYVTVRHDPLQDARIEAYVNFMKPAKHRELISIGTGTGERQELTLGVNGVKDSNIIASSIKIYVAGSVFTNFSYNSEVSTVTLSVAKGASIVADYEYERDTEVWRKMTLEKTEPYNDVDGTYVSYYSYTLPDEDATDKVTSNVRLKMVRPEGNNHANFGTATGKKQLFTFQHAAIASTIKFSDSNVQWSYDEDSGILTVLAPKGTALVAFSKWRAEEVTIHSFAAGWSVA